MHDQPVAARSYLRPPEIPSSLEPLRSRIESALAPAAALLPDPAAGGRTHFGGQPLGAPGTRWPRSPARPMSFIGQIDLADVESDILPGSGLLQLFYDVEEQRWGFDPSDRQWWHVNFVAASDPLVPVPVPAERFPAFERTSLQVRPYVSLPSPFDHHWPDPSGAANRELLIDAYGDFLREWQASVFGNDGQAHQVLGHVDWVQGDARNEAESLRRATVSGAGAGRPSEASDWRLLLQVASDDALGFMWGDLGYLYLMAEASESRRGDFSGCHLTLQCG